MRAIVQSCCSEDSIALRTGQHRDYQHVRCKFFAWTSLDPWFAMRAAVHAPAPLRYNQTKTNRG